MYLPTLIWSLTFNNSTDTSKAKCQGNVAVNSSQEFPWKSHVAVPKYLIFQ